MQLNTQKPNSLDPSAAHSPTHLIHCLDRCVPPNILIMGKDATWALGEESAKAGRSWGIVMLHGGPLWMFPLAWLSAMIFRLQWFGLTLGSELDQPVQQFRNSRALCLISGPLQRLQLWSELSRRSSDTQCLVLHCTARQEYPVMWNH